MTSNDPRLQIPEYLSGHLSESDRQAFEQQLALDSKLQAETEDLRLLWQQLELLPEEQPSAALRARFYQQLQVITAEAKGRVAKASSQDKPSFWTRWTGWQQLAAAAALFLGGLYVGQVNRTSHEQSDQIAQMRAQVQSLRETVALSLLDRQSASSRLQGVTWSSRVDRPDSELLGALMSALNDDPNVNVRLSSVDALERYADDDTVRKALVSSIGRQNSPLVQIALIDTLVHMRDSSAMGEFKRLSENAKLNSAVRQRASWALVNLEDKAPSKSK